MITNPNQLFFTRNIQNGLAQLEEDESRHLVSVLRKNVGEKVFVTDGKGSFFAGELIEAHKKRAMIRLDEEFPQKKDRKIELHIAIPPTKINDRFEWFLEKATEIGVDRITPMLTKRTEKAKLRLDRAEKIVISAMKQSTQAFLPKLDELTKFEKLLDEIPDDVQKFIPYCEGDEQPFLQDLLKPEGKVCMLIGPAGDFTPEEVVLAFKKGFIPVSLGASRLRSETAGIAVACMAKFAR